MNSDSSKHLVPFFIGGIFTSIFGVLFHFLYGWSGSNPIVGLFCAVNESTWEHLKLLYFPFLVWFFISFFWFGKQLPNYTCYSFLSVFLGMLSIIVLFYTYTGVLGFSIDAVNIALFFLAVMLTFFLQYHFTHPQITTPEGRYSSLKLPSESDQPGICNWLCAFLFLILATLFFYFTNHTPNLGLFQIPK